MATLLLVSPSSLTVDWEGFLTGEISDKILDGLGKVEILPSYITVYLKGEPINDVTLNYMMFLEDAQQCSHVVGASLRNNIEYFFDRFTTEI